MRIVLIERARISSFNVVEILVETDKIDNSSKIDDIILKGFAYKPENRFFNEKLKPLNAYVRDYTQVKENLDTIHQFIVTQR